MSYLGIPVIYFIEIIEVELGLYILLPVEGYEWYLGAKKEQKYHNT